MKLRRLVLRKFGPFTDQAFDFSTPTLHVICGDNETGKSTTLRAVEAALFGFGHTTPDDHTHKASDLEIEFEIDFAGEPHTLIRRKRAKNSLLSAAGEPVDDSLVAERLGRVDADLFALLFGLDSARLRSGADAIVSSGGRLGEAIFGAGLAGTGVGALLADLDKAAERLYKSRGSTQTIPVLIKQLATATEAVTEATLTSDAWEAARRQITDAKAAVDDLEQRLAEARAERSRLSRLKRALPDFYEKRSLRDKREALEPVYAIDDDQAAAYTEATRSVQMARESKARIAKQLDDLKGQRDSAQDFSPWLSASDEIGVLGNERALWLEFRSERPELEATLLAATERVRVAEDALGIAANAPTPALPTQLLHALQTLIARAQDLGPRVDAATAGERRRASDVVTAQRDLDAIAPPDSVSELVATTAAVASAGDLDALRAQLAARIRKDEERLTNLIVRLGLPADIKLAAVAIPGESSRNAAARQLEECRRALTRLDQDAQQHDGRRAPLVAQMETLMGSTPLVSAEDLRAARAARNQLWRELRPALRGERSPEIQDQHKADEFESCLDAADHLGDRLREGATQLAEGRAVKAQLDSLEREMSRLVDARTDCLAALERAENQWLQLWRDANLPAPAPNEASAFAANLDKAIEATLAHADDVASLASLQAQYADACGLLRNALGAEEPAGQRPLAQWRAMCAKRIEDARAIEATRAQLADRLAERTENARQACLELAELRSQLEQTLADWQKTAADLPFPIGKDPGSAAPQLAAYQSLRSERQARDALVSKRAAKLERASMFETEARRLGEALLGTESRSLAPEAICSALVQRRQAALAGAQRVEAIDQSIASLEPELAETEGAIGRNLTVLQALRDKAGATSDEQFHARASAAREARHLDARLAEIDQRLTREAPRGQLPGFLGELETINPDQLAAALEQAEGLVLQLEPGHAAAHQALGTASEKLRAQEHTRGAADAQERAQELLAELHDGVSDYVDTVIAATLLRAAMADFAARMHGPVLARTSAILSAMTAGSVAGLEVDYDSKGEQRLFARRSSGTTLPIDGLSEGTRDQLFLALRLACIEAHVAKHGPMPLILDDIFQSFDDARTVAALEVLAELAQTCQVLLFTHHEQVTHLASRHLGPRVTAHRLKPVP